MSNTWLADAEAMSLFDDESAEGYFDDESAEDYFDGDTEDIDFESYDDDAEATVVRDNRRAQARRGAYARAVARRRALARRALARRALARRAQARRAQARRAALVRARRRGMAPIRPWSPATARAEVRQAQAAGQALGLESEVQADEVRQTRAAVQELGLESEVQADAVAGALAAQARRIDSQGATLGATAVANTVANQLQASFPGVAANPFIRAGLPLAPLLLLKPGRRESGVQGFVSDPRVWAGALVAGVTIAGEINSRVQSAEEVRITRFTTHLSQNTRLRFLAEARDSGGAVLRNKRIKWSEVPVAPGKPILTVARDGLVTAGTKTGPTTVRAELDGTPTVFDEVPLTVS